jgi:hypothetical protein
MKKYKGWILVFFIIILTIFILWIIKTPLIASYLSKKLKTDVSISSIGISTNRIVINNFKLKNPPKTKSKYAFVTNRITFSYSFSKLFSSPTIIDNILLENINLDIECDNPLCTKNNWTTIVKKIDENEQKKKSEKEILIKKLVMKEMDVQIVGLGLDFNKTKTAHISHIEFNNINSKTGFPTQQLIAAIFRSAGLKDYLKGLLDTKGIFENVIDTFKGVSDNSLEESLKDL